MGKARDFTLRVRLNTAEYKKLERYANSKNEDMSKIIRKYIWTLPWKAETTESDSNYPEET